MTYTNTAADSSGVVGGVLVDDRGCIKCDYNLRGLTPEGACPECSESVASTIREPLLKYSDPGYIKTLRLGLRLILLSIIISICVGGIAGVLAGIAAASGEDELSPTLTLALGAIGLVTLTLTVLGWWLYAAPEPGYTGSITWASRKTMRVALGFAAAFWLGNIALTVFAPAEVLISSLLNVLASCAYVVLGLAAMLYTKRLAYRIPDRLSARRASLVFKMAIAAGVGYALALAGIAIAFVDELIGIGIGGAGAVIGAVCLLVGGIVFLFLIIRLSRKFAEIIAQQREPAPAVV